MACAEEPLPLILQDQVDIEPTSADRVRIIEKDPVEKAPIKRQGPIFASLPYFCDPYEYSANIVLMAAACRPFLPSIFRAGFPSQDLRGRSTILPYR